MTFMILNVQRNMMVQQKSQLESQEVVISDYYQTTTQKLQTLVSNASTNNVDLDNNAAYLELQYLQQSLDAQKESIESQLKVLNSQIESFQKAEETNIKSECKLNLLG